MRTGLKTVILTALLAVVALGAALFGTQSPRPASAGPVSVTALNSSLCLSLGVAFAGLDATDAASDCLAMTRQYTNGKGSVQHYVRCLRGYTDDEGVRRCIADNGEDEPYQVLPSDFAGLDLDKNQVHAGQRLVVFFFVNDDEQVRFITDKGKFIDLNGDDIGDDYGCNNALVADAPYTGDPDCDGDKTTFNSIGDGVVVARIQIDADTELGTGHITAIQGGVGVPVDFTVVGVAETITTVPLFGKNVIQTGATVPPEIGSDDPALPTDCKFGANLGAVLDAIGKAEQTIVVVKALDDDGAEVAGALLNWDHVLSEGPDDDQPVTPQGGVALPQTPTVDLGSIGIGFVQFVCGGEQPGDLKLRVMFDHGSAELDPLTSEDEYSDITITVIGPPASMTLAADPPVVACDGVSSSKISATVKTADGQNAANGADVSFSVQVLGTANPLVSDTAAGVATTVVTPLSGAGADDIGTRGVPVIATAGDIQASILVACSDIPAPVPAAGGGAGAGAGTTPAGGGAGAGAGAPRGTIGGPDTGSGGAAGQGALSWWPALGLAAAGMALAATRTALKRRS